MDNSKPLRRVVYMVGVDGKEIMYALKCERLPKFCYLCDCPISATKSRIGYIAKRGGNLRDRIREKRNGFKNREFSQDGGIYDAIKRENYGKLRNKRKKHKGGNREEVEESPILSVQRKLMEGASPFKLAVGD
ncbi:hypothetical protein Goari_006413 [Gossypium aridum]|uniref:Uncharacterized protein n=1 Tax=Gossypium aridum TaxID=34290 RepID=A0A7J8XMU4_GOSAI|nr:hypothetical protein [Gossypium aridum]